MLFIEFHYFHIELNRNFYVDENEKYVIFNFTILALARLSIHADGFDNCIFLSVISEL